MPTPPMQPPSTDNLRSKSLASITEISADAWDALVPPGNPFVRHAFLAALERSGSVGGNSGWLPCPIVVHAGDKLVAALPLYCKHDSYGEFIFDWAWADAAARNGIAYYPKLVSAIPFTPATGARLLHLPQFDPTQLWTVVAAAIEQTRQQLQAHSVHILFCDAGEARAWQAHGFCTRKSYQFHWQKQPHWHSFADYAEQMRSRDRKQMRRERKSAQGHGLALQMQPAQALNAADWQAVYGLYRQTIWEKGAQAYLTPAFFASLPQTFAAHTFVATARQQGQIRAMALYFRADDALFGRYWGADAHFDALHFELCYYLPIEWGLQNGICRFEAGAQGEHKIKRGLLPNLCHSAHRLEHPGLSAAVAHFVEEEAAVVAQHMHTLAELSPFHRVHVD